MKYVIYVEPNRSNPTRRDYTMFKGYERRNHHNKHTHEEKIQKKNTTTAQDKSYHSVGVNTTNPPR